MPVSLTHDLLVERKYIAHLRYLDHLIFCVETGADMNDYQAWCRRADAQRAKIEADHLRQDRRIVKESNEFFNIELPTFFVVSSMPVCK